MSKEISRRRALELGAAAAGVAAVGSVTNPAGASTPDFPVAPQHTTLARTLQHGTPGAKGYRKIVDGPGEGTVVRTELLGGAKRRKAKRCSLLAFAQFTDMHIIDAQSPARVEFLDRYDDPGQPLAGQLPFQSAYRPWEMLTAHVAESMVRGVNKLKGAPITGRRLDFTICTGDNADNTQYNELRWHIDLLDGRKTIRPDSGDHTKWEGVGGADDPDASYYHPAGTVADHYRDAYGYPVVRHLHDRCRAPFRSTGVNTPWYTVFGNHDGLAQGTVPSDALLDAIATGSIKPTGLAADVDLAELVKAISSGDPSALEALLTGGPVRLVTADPRRKLLNRKRTVVEHFSTTGTPAGHGYNSRNLRDGTAYYSFSRNGVRCISLDTVNPNGYSDGSIDTIQLEWLTGLLRASRHQLVLIFSHHTIGTMTNTLGTDRVDGTTVRDLLLQHRNVVGWINGHTHVNQVVPHARPDGTGFWEVNTAAHVDWPQQARIVELVDNGDGTLSLFGTIIDHAAGADRPSDPKTPLELAALSRELAVNDPQREAETASRDGRRGTRADRNVELLVRAASS